MAAEPAARPPLVLAAPPAAPPANVDWATEAHVLGAIILDPSGLALVQPVLGDDPRVMDLQAHSFVYEAILSLDAAGAPVDLLTVARALQAADRLHAVGGHAFLASLTDACPSTAHLAAHARALADLAAVRRAQRAAHVAEQRARTATRPEDIAAAAAAVSEALEGRGGASTRRLGDTLDAAFDRIEEGAKRPAGKLVGVRTGYKDLDRLTGGWRAGQFVVVGARKAVGKTAFALALARAAATECGVLFLSLEMPERELVDRLLCAESGVHSERLRDSLLSADDQTALAGAADRLDRLALFVDDESELTMAQVRAKVRAAKRLATRAGTTLRLVLCDYIGLLRGEGWSEGRQQEVAKISRQMKALAKREGVTMLCLAQINRDVDKRRDKRAQAADLRESGQIENDADILMLLQRPASDDPDAPEAQQAEASLDVVKHRGGKLATFKLHFKGDTGVFHAVHKEAA